MNLKLLRIITFSHFFGFINSTRDLSQIVRRMLSDRSSSVLSLCLFCPVCLSVTLVYSSQMVWWITMKLVTEAGLGPGHTLC